ncbi:MAG: bifunctional phosphopantothenoylcysteine decarboxylase/phosphopantothenate--cysteine ligase CoaBC [Ignavibacteriae bacterium]|nr:bifunctional phosphopantothenoylcysteine decarboxylase/phosphopantothenate--cysteine ligase CoaBC [Ignavibacteriota bacterium]
MPLKGKKILLGITGGIAAYKMCSFVRLLVKAGAEVKVVMTPSAAKLVSPLTLSVLTNNDVVINMYPEHSDPENIETVSAGTWHIKYGLWADVFIIAPATANSIAKITCGISDNFLLSTVLACRCPVFFAPTMDVDMYNKPVTQENIKKLAGRGYMVIEPFYGELASGLFGMGKMAEPEIMFDVLKIHFEKKKDLKNKKVLITAGPTVEPIDAVRYISNYSSGKMGFDLARAADERGADVTLIAGPVNLETPNGIKRIDVKSSDEMYKAVIANLKGKDVVIMTAAVADFKPVNVPGNKIKKEDKNFNMNIELEKTTDILKAVGKNKKNFFLIGFALETDNGIPNAQKKLKEKNLDMIVLNNPKEEGAGFGTDTNVVSLIDKRSIKKLEKMTKYEAGNEILNYYLKKIK